jgi:hypothetical protein
MWLSCSSLTPVAARSSQITDVFGLFGRSFPDADAAVKRVASRRSSVASSLHVESDAAGSRPEADGGVAGGSGGDSDGAAGDAAAPDAADGDAKTGDDAPPEPEPEPPLSELGQAIWEQAEVRAKQRMLEARAKRHAAEAAAEAAAARAREAALAAARAREAEAAAAATASAIADAMGHVGEFDVNDIWEGADRS